MGVQRAWKNLISCLFLSCHWPSLNNSSLTSPLFSAWTKFSIIELSLHEAEQDHQLFWYLFQQRLVSCLINFHPKYAWQDMSVDGDKCFFCIFMRRRLPVLKKNWLSKKSRLFSLCCLQPKGISIDGCTGKFALQKTFFVLLDLPYI